MRDSVCHNAFWKVEIRRLEWFRYIDLYSFAGCQLINLVVGLEKAATLDWISWLVKLIVSHNLLGGGSFKECK